jgi:uncharacterized protein (DUF736 family)
MSNEKYIGALWVGKSQKGKMFLSGNVELVEGDKVKIIIFKNERKEEGSKQPDYRILRQKPKDEDIPF